MDMTEETTTSWRAGAPPTAPEARVLAKLIVLLRESIPDDGDREAAIRYAVTAWDPRTGVNGLESMMVRAIVRIPSAV